MLQDMREGGVQRIGTSPFSKKKIERNKLVHIGNFYGSPSFFSPYQHEKGRRRWLSRVGSCLPKFWPNRTRWRQRSAFNYLPTPLYVASYATENISNVSLKMVNKRYLLKNFNLYSLQHTLAESKRLGSIGNIGLLTSDTRQNWYKAYQVLKVHDSETLSKIEGSSFILCLDENVQESGSGKDKLTSTALNSLHGLGTRLQDIPTPDFSTQSSNLGLLNPFQP